VCLATARLTVGEACRHTLLKYTLNQWASSEPKVINKSERIKNTEQSINLWYDRLTIVSLNEESMGADPPPVQAWEGMHTLPVNKAN